MFMICLFNMSLQQTCNAELLHSSCGPGCPCNKALTDALAQLHSRLGPCNHSAGWHHEARKMKCFHCLIRQLHLVAQKLLRVRQVDLRFLTAETGCNKTVAWSALSTSATWLLI